MDEVIAIRIEQVTYELDSSAFTLDGLQVEVQIALKIP